MSLKSEQQGSRRPNVELLGQYSKNSDQGKQLSELIKKVESSRKRQVSPIVTPPPRTHKLARRLSDEDIVALVAAYRAGDSTPTLQQRFQLSQGSVLKILSDHNVTMRGQGLSHAQIEHASELYREGWTLARLGTRFQTAPNTVRRALISNGVVMRARGGSRPAK